MPLNDKSPDGILLTAYWAIPSKILIYILRFYSNLSEGIGMPTKKVKTNICLLIRKDKDKLYLYLYIIINLSFVH
jgi:hypothetical protein